jgi:SecY interacting protein Syd
VTLVQVWSDRDFDRLVVNLLGHALQKTRAKAELTLFIATTDEEELFLSVENASGRVLLESPGQPPVREVAPRLEDLLVRVDPVLGSPDAE